MRCWSLYGDQGQETCTLDGGVELTLINSTCASQSRRNDFAVFGDEVAQNIDVFVVDFNNVSNRETAVTLAFEQQVLWGALGACLY